MDDHALKMHALVITVAVQTLVEAMGMYAENQQCIHRGESLAYDQHAFEALIERNGCHSNSVLSMSWN